MKKCSKCEEVKGLTSFHKLSSSKDGHRPDCKDCCKKQRDRKNKKDYIRYTTDLMAHGILQRVRYAINKPKNRCYKDNNVQCTLGDNLREISNYLYDNFYEEIKLQLDSGMKPSVDRINAKDNYSPDNIRIIDLSENIKMGVNNAVKKTSKPIKAIKNSQSIVYKSISHAANELSIKRDTIYYHLDKNTVSKKGYKFESVS